MDATIPLLEIETSVTTPDSRRFDTYSQLPRPVELKPLPASTEFAWGETLPVAYTSPEGLKADAQYIGIDHPPTAFEGTPKRESEETRQVSEEIKQVSEGVEKAPEEIEKVSEEIEEKSEQAEQEAEEAGLESEEFALTNATKFNPDRLRSDQHHATPWLPYTLRWPYLVNLIILALGLSLVTILLLWYSVTNNGLGNDNSSSVVLFGWRFSPTLVTVLYVLFTTMLGNDVGRTEAFARLSKESGAMAPSTLTLSPGSWWNTLMDGWCKSKNNGKRSWVLICASMANIIGVLVISPLSSALLEPEDLSVTNNANFKRISIHQHTPLTIEANDVAYFRTISNMIQNLTTSAWLSKEYAVLPFWPSNLDRIPLGASLSSEPQQWHAKTTVFSTELNCRPMTLKGTSVNYYNFSGFNALLPNIEMASDDGCTYALALDSGHGIVGSGGGLWCYTSEFTWPVWDNEGPMLQRFNSSDGCRKRELILLNTPWWNPNEEEVSIGWGNDSHFAPTFRANGQVCSSTFYMASIETTASITATDSTVTFDEDLFDDTRIPIDSAFMDTKEFQDLFLNQNWTTKLDLSSYTVRPSTSGPLVLLAATYNFNTEAMMIAEDIIHRALQVKQRFFGEVLQAVFITIGDQDASITSGKITTIERRIVVNPGIAMALCILFAISSILFGLVLYHSRLQRRQLNLAQDPGSAMAIALLVSHELRTRSCFEGLDNASRLQTQVSLRNRRFFVDHDGLQVSEIFGSIKEECEVHKTTKKHGNWRPIILRRWVGVVFILVVLSILAAVNTIYILSRGPGLYETAFVYQASLKVFSSSTFTLAPYSIVPTLIAVGVGLWWSSLEETFKRLQPYVAMAKTPTAISCGAGLSYATSYLLWAAAKAISKQHWILALVSMGAFFSQIFTVTMSALWEKIPSNSQTQINLVRHLDLRKIPVTFDIEGKKSEDDGDPYRGRILSNLYNDLPTNWLYSATIQLAYGGPEPVWSRNGWSFVPLDLSSVPERALIQNTGSNITSSRNQIINTLGSEVNVTVTTPALRARIDCTAYQNLGNLSNWAHTVDLTNSTMWNVTANPTNLKTGYELGASGFNELDNFSQTFVVSPGNASTQITTSFFANPAALQCCANETNKTPGRSAVGYWSYNIQDDSDFVLSISNTAFPINLTVKWILGNPVQALYADKYGDLHLIWKDVPHLTALNCAPVIERSTATVTLDRDTRTVHDYKILENITACTEAWSDSYETHNRTVGNTKEDYLVNITTSYGVLFQDALLNAAAAASIGTMWSEVGYGVENLEDKTFNFRQTGLNVDFMSYAMYSLVDNDPDVLLNSTVLQQSAETVFSTFFQHFASSNASANGGPAYQPINDTIPWDLGPILNLTVSGAPASSHQDTNNSFFTNTTITALVSTRIEELQMSSTAVFLSTFILIFLLLSAVVVYFIDYHYFKSLRGDVDTIASIISLVYDSPRLLKWVAKNRDAKDWNKGSNSKIKVRLMGFVGGSGKERWGIEIVESSSYKRKGHIETEEDGLL